MIWPVVVSPVKAILSTSMCRRQGGAGGRAVTRDDVDNAVGEAGFLGQGSDTQGRQRRLLGRLKDDRAAGRQGGAPLPRLHQQREVPGNDLADDADRFVTGVAEVRPFDGDGLALDLVGPAGVIAVALDGQGQVRGQGIVIRFAVVKRLQSRQRLHLLIHQVCQAIQQAATFRGAHSPPGSFLKCFASRRDSQVDVRTIGLGDLADDLSGRRVERGKGFSGNAVYPLAPDKHGLTLVVQFAREMISQLAR